MNEAIDKVGTAVGWGPAVETAAAELAGASQEQQRSGCAWIEKEYGAEAAAKLRALLGLAPGAGFAKKLEAATAKQAPKGEKEIGLAKEAEAAALTAGRLAALTGTPKAATKSELKSGAAVLSKIGVATARAVPKTSVAWGAERRSWDEVVVPVGVNRIEALTYVPGLVGDIVEWIVAGAHRPNRVMALGVALAVVGTLIGRRVEGPTGCGTHLFIFIIAPTGWGKDWPLWCGNKLMIMVGAKDLIGPSEFVSGRGLIKLLKRKPLVISLVDELADLFELINKQDDNPWVRDLMGHFKKLYNSWQIYVTAETMKDQSMTINHPAFTMVGACTPESLFSAMTPRDVEGGFANRPMLLPFEGCRRPPERDVPEGMDEPPAELVEKLRALMPRPKAALDKRSDEIVSVDGEAPPVAASDRAKIGWGSDAAKRAYFAFSGEMDRWEDRDKHKFALGMRATENGERCATILAAGCGSSTVDLPDIEWGLAWSRMSFEAADGGFKKYMRDYFEFPKFCAEVEKAIAEAGGFMSDRDLGRMFRRNMKWGNELEKALHQLVSEDRIERGQRRGARGPSAYGYRLVGEAA